MVFTTSIRHPNEFSAVSGKTQLVKEINSINQSIGLLLKTTKGELYGDPYFGSSLFSLIFSDVNGETLYQLIKEEIVKTLTEQETRILISEEDITIQDAGFSLNISMAYQIRNTNYRGQTAVVVQKRKEEEY